MAVTQYRELAGRTFQHRFGESPTAEIRYAATLDNPATSHQEILNTIGIFHGSSHPEYSYLQCVEGSIQENSPTPYHVEITYRYELVIQAGTGGFQANPLARPDVWTFSTGGAEVPALVYYEGAGNGDIRPLINSAGDFFEGITANEAEVRATIAGNRPTFPLSIAAAVTNGINGSAYLGGAPYTWKCAGVGAQQAVEVISGISVPYWEISVELIYRQSGWLLQLPNVGWHYLSGGNPAKEHVFVRDKASGTDIPASSPQPLNTNGSLKYTGSNFGPPDILLRRVNPVLNFSQYFGVPPF